MTFDGTVLSNIQPGETANITYVYTVPEDTDATAVFNAVAVKNGDDKQTPEDVENDIGLWSIDKALTGSTGDLLTYTVTVTNEGVIDLFGLVLLDELTGGTGRNFPTFNRLSSNLDNNPAQEHYQTASGVLDVLRTGETVTLTFNYMVQPNDAYLINTVTASKGGYTESDDVRTSVYVDVAPPAGTYRIIVHYVYAVDGSTAAPDQTRIYMKLGDAYEFISPEIADHVASMAIASGTLPAHNLEITVFYVDVGEEMVEVDMSAAGSGSTRVTRKVDDPSARGRRPSAASLTAAGGIMNMRRMASLFGPEPDGGPDPSDGRGGGCARHADRGQHDATSSRRCSAATPLTTTCARSCMAIPAGQLR